MPRRFFAVIALSILLLGCSSKSDNAEGSGGGDGGTDGGAPGITLTATPMAVNAGQEILYACETFTLPDAVTITDIAPTYGQGTHHLDVFQVVLVPEQDGAFDCPEVIKSNWIPIFIGGTNPDPLPFPAGYGLQLAAGTQLVMQRHLLNTTMATEMTTASVRLTTSDQPLQAAGGFGFESTMFSIPAAASGYQVTTTCAAPADMHFWAGFGHAHRLAQSVEVSVNGATVFSEPWSFTDQPHIPTSFDVKAGDVLSLVCTYNNPTPNAVGYGLSSTDEMCAWFGSRYPYMGFSGCIDGSPVAF